MESLTLQAVAALMPLEIKCQIISHLKALIHTLNMQVKKGVHQNSYLKSTHLLHTEAKECKNLHGAVFLSIEFIKSYSINYLIFQAFFAICISRNVWKYLPLKQPKFLFLLNIELIATNLKALECIRPCNHHMRPLLMQKLCRYF